MGELPPLLHLVSSAVGGSILTVVIFLFYQWVSEKVSPPEHNVYDDIWIGDQIEFSPPGTNAQIVGKVFGIERGNTWKDVDIVVRYHRTKYRIDFHKGQWEKLE